MGKTYILFMEEGAGMRSKYFPRMSRIAPSTSAIWKTTIMTVTVSLSLSSAVLASSSETNTITKSPSPSTLDIDDFNYHLKRTLIAQNRIQAETLFHWFPSSYTDILVFTGIGKDGLTNLSNGRTIVTNSSEEIKGDFVIGQFILLNHPSHFEEICNKSSRPVHWLHFEENRNQNTSHFKWIRSHGKMNNLFSVGSTGQEIKLDEKAFFEDVDNQTVCISGSKGSSTSSAFQGYIAKRLAQRYPDRYILRMRTMEFIKMVNNSLAGNSMEKALETVIRDELEVKPNTRIELILEDFDEVIGSIDEDLAFEILDTLKSSFKYVRTWLGDFQTRERKLNVICYKMDHLSENEMVHALSKFWSRNKSQVNSTKLAQFAKETLKVLDSEMSSKLDDVSDHPMLANMIAEVYEDEALEYSKLNDSMSEAPPKNEINSAADVYQIWVGKKINDYRRSPEGNSTKLTDKQLPEVHALLGIEQLFPQEFDKMDYLFTPDILEELLKVGIMQKPNGVHGPPLFPDRSVATYFVARFVADKLTGKGGWGGEELDKFKVEKVLASKPVELVTCEGVSGFSAKKTKSFQFLHSHVGYFLNHFLKNSSSPTNSTLTFEQMIHSSVDADFLHTFNFFSALNPNNSTTTIFNEGLICLAVKKSSLEFVKVTLAMFEQNHDLTLNMQNSLLRLAVHRGVFSIVDFLLEAKGLRSLVENLNSETKHLLRDAIAYTNYNSGRVVNEKIKIIQKLVGINPKLLEQRDEYNKSPFHTKYAHVELLLQLINLGGDVLARDDYNSTILHLPWNHLSSKEYEQFLMKIPLDKLHQIVQLKDNAGKTPLMKLVSQTEPTPETLGRFKEAEADFNTGQKFEGSVLSIALTFRRKVATLRKIIEFGADPSWKEGVGKSLLHIAANSAIEESVQFLVDEQGLDVNIGDEEGLTPLDHLILGGRPFIKCLETGLALQKRGGRFNETVNGQSVLHQVAKQELYNSVLLLLRLGKGVDVNGVDEEGNTPLHLLLKYNIYSNKKYMTLAELLWNNADPNVSNKKGETPFQLALNNEKLDFETFSLLKSKSGIEWTPDQATLALIIAVRAGNVDGISTLINEMEGHGGNLEYRESFTGDTLLHLAARFGNEKAVYFLVEGKGADVNGTSNKNLTPLIEASKYNDKGVGLKLIKYLIDRGADVYGKEAGSGSTFLHGYLDEYKLPSASQFHSLVKYMIRKKHVDLFDVEGGFKASGFGRLTPYQIALRHGHFDKKTLELLNSAGVGMNQSASAQV